MTAEFDARDKPWAVAVTIAKEYADKANAQIEAGCADLGIPPMVLEPVLTHFRR